MAKNAATYPTSAPEKVTKDATLPVRGRVAELVLAKKLPKNTEAVIVALFKGGNGIELAGGEHLDAIFSTREQAELLTQLEAVGATAKANEVTRIPGIATIAPVIAVGLGTAERRAP